MISTHRVRGRLAVGGLVTLAFAAACGENSVLSPISPTQSSAAEAQGLAPSAASLAHGAGGGSTIPTAAQVVLPLDGGMFVPFVANKSGRTATEFWDNVSADSPSPVIGCNVGFYASGTFGPGCLFEAPGSNANQGGYLGGAYLATEGRKPAAFVFRGGFSYTVKFLGSYGDGNSEVGYFTKVGTVYTFNRFNFVVNQTATVNTGGKDWGFYIRNGFNPEPGGCATSPNATHCSDATGGFERVPYQHFALFRNTAGTSLLVGAEDNKLDTFGFAGGGRDSDYNDYIFSVVAQAVQCNRHSDEDSDSDKDSDSDSDRSKNQNKNKDCNDDDKKKKCDADKSMKDPKVHNKNHDCRSESGRQHDKKFQG